MALPESRIFVSPEEYLALERGSDERHEYFGGRIYAMAGESRMHSTICFNLYGIIHAQLRGKRYRGFSPNMKVSAGRKDAYYYPDLAVACGEPVFHDQHGDVLVNPTAILEVLSPSTESKDRGEKFFRYQQIESLTDYLLVSQKMACIEHYTRQADRGWFYSITLGLSNVLHLASVDCRIPLAEVYERVEFPPEEVESDPDPRQ